MALALLVLQPASLVLALEPPPPLEPPPQPVPDPRRPKPYFSWDTIPLAFHGANRSGMYNESAVRTLAKYQLVTIVSAPCPSRCAY